MLSRAELSVLNSSVHVIAAVEGLSVLQNTSH